MNPKVPKVELWFGNHTYSTGYLIKTGRKNYTLALRHRRGKPIGRTFRVRRRDVRALRFLHSESL